MPGPAGANNTSFLCSWLLLERGGPPAAWPAFSQPVSSWGLQGRPGLASCGGVSGQCPDQDKVAKGWRRCWLSCQPGQARRGGGCQWRRPGHTPDKAARGGSPSGRGCPRAKGLPHPKVAQREGHIPVSAMTGMWFLRTELEEVPSGGRGWGRGLTSRAGDRCAESSRCPSGPRRGGGRGGPGRTRPPTLAALGLAGSEACSGQVRPGGLGVTSTG